MRQIQIKLVGVTRKRPGIKPPDNVKEISLFKSTFESSNKIIINRLGSYSFSILYHIVIKKMYSLMHETVVLCQGRIFLMAIGVWVFTENTL